MFAEVWCVQVVVHRPKWTSKNVVYHWRRLHFKKDLFLLQVELIPCDRSKIRLHLPLNKHGWTHVLHIQVSEIFESEVSVNKIILVMLFFVYNNSILSIHASV